MGFGEWLLFILCSVPACAMSSDESLVFGLQLDLNRPRTIDSYVRYDFRNQNSSTGPKELAQSTICYRFWILQYRDILPFFSYAYSDEFDNAFLLFQAVSSLDFYYNDEKEYSFMALDDTVESWHHHCFVFTHPTYKLYVDGTFGTGGKLGAKSGIIPLNGTMYLGHDQDSFDGGRDPEQTLTGYITQVNVWDYPLDADTIKKMALCLTNARGNILSTDTTTMETKNVVIEQMQITTFCKRTEKAIIISEQWLPDVAERFCHLADAQIYIPGSEEENSLLFNQSRQFSKKCSGNSYRLMYLGATDAAVEGLWARMSDRKPINYTKWFPGEPNGSGKDNCIALRRSDPFWGDILCDFKLCFPCSRTNKDYLQLRGLCEAHEHQTRYTLDGYINLRPYFRGYYKMIVYHSGEKEWFLRDAHTNTTLAQLPLFEASEFPIGRHSWEVISPFCERQVGSSVVLGLSSCTTEEFMCTDGSCVHRSVRCNLQDDCLDRTDEENCTIVSFSDSYHNYRPPPGAAFGIPLKITPVIDLIRFSKIDDINLAFHMEIEVALIWIDRNLHFKNIKSEEAKNKLSSSEVDGIWRPEIEFLNVNDGQLQLLKSGVYVRQIGDPEPPLFTDVQMDTIFQPKSSRLVQRQQYYASFNCLFTLFSYPFDTQTCNIIIKMSSADMKVIDIENATVLYNENRLLSKYVVKNVDIFKKPRGDYAVMEVMFALERRYSLLVLTIFLPTFLLVGIGYGTLFIKLKDFDTRLMTTLTTLLVFFTMFDQVSNGLPDTAYIKMVDLWFFFCIFLIFSITILHIIAESFDNDGDDAKARLMRVSPIGVKNELTNNYVVKPKWTGAKLMYICRTIIYPAIMVIFGIFFWVTVLVVESL